MKEKALKIIKSKYFIGTILTIILYFIYLAIAKIAPFGENSILKSDLYKQYAEFLAYYKDSIKNKNKKQEKVAYSCLGTWEWAIIFTRHLHII